MGMAASQARFLGLTARKSNVEYQGQQVNQQRTALANESANLYNQMMTLDVPTPPSTTDFYTTTYELEGSKPLNGDEDYTFQNATKTYDIANEYNITVINKQPFVYTMDKPYSVGNIEESEVTDKEATDTTDAQTHKVYEVNLVPSKDGDYSPKLTYDESKLSAYDESGTFGVNPYQVYKVEGDNIVGKEKCCTEEGVNYLFYQDTKGNNYFMKEDDFKAYLEGTSTSDILNTNYAYVQYKDIQRQIMGIMEKSSTGRFSSLQVYNDDTYPEELRGIRFALNVKQVFNQDGYDDAMNDYEFQKDIYEQAINNINAKTEVIQKQDQNLELRLDQLDTEQNAIKTEMDAVTKVLKDNVEKTFKTFNA